MLPKSSLLLSLFQYTLLRLEAFSFKNAPILLSAEENTLCIFSLLMAEVIRLLDKVIQVSCGDRKRSPFICFDGEANTR